MQVRIPGRPNGRRGWVPREALGGLHTVRTALVIDRRTLRATLREEAAASGPRASASARPARRPPPGASGSASGCRGFGGSYGPWAFGTSAYSNRLTGWPGGGVIGIHGTDQPGLIPGRPSHGCVRVPNGAIRRLAQAHADRDAGSDPLTVSRSPSSSRLRSTFLSNLPTLVFGTSSMNGELVRDPPLRHARGEVLLQLLGATPRGPPRAPRRRAGARTSARRAWRSPPPPRSRRAPSARSRGRPRRSTRRRT